MGTFPTSPELAFASTALHMTSTCEAVGSGTEDRPGEHAGIPRRTAVSRRRREAGMGEIKLRRWRAGGTSTIPVLGPGSRRSRPPPRPAAATVLSRTAVAARGPLPDRIARGHRRPAESAGPSELMEAQVALAHAARAAPWGSRR